MTPTRFHQGRLLDHVHLPVADLEESRAFYAAALGALGLEVVMEGRGFFAADELFVSTGEPTAGVHPRVSGPDREAVHRFHEAVLAAGGTDNGGPGERSYHPGYYAAYALDPEGWSSSGRWQTASTLWPSGSMT